MGIQEIAHSGKPAQLLDHYGISAGAIVEKAKQLVS
jgi:transketolase C-terminal domain/subunit